MDSHFNLDISGLSSELKFLLEIMKNSGVENPPNICKERTNGIDWGIFLQLAKHHRVYPSIYRILKGTDGNGVPPFVFQELKRLYKNNTLKMLHLAGEMENISKLFTDNEIRSLFIKGPVLAAALYGDISLRTSSDLDILVPLSDLTCVEEILVKQGYIKDDYILTVLNDWKWRHHHITFFHAQKGIKVEIHWRLNPGPAKEPSFNALWERKKVSSLTGYPVYMLGSEDLFLFLVLHGARHGWSRLRWLEDIRQLTKHALDWDKSLMLLRECQCLHIGEQAIILSSQLLNSPIMKEMKVGVRSRKLAQDALFYFKQMVNLHAEPVPFEIARYHKHHLFSLMSYRQKLLFILSLLYPYPVDAETLPLPKILHFLYFPLRPVLCAWRKTRKHALP